MVKRPNLWTISDLPGIPENSAKPWTPRQGCFIRRASRACAPIRRGFSRNVNLVSPKNRSSRVAAINRASRQMSLSSAFIATSCMRCTSVNSSGVTPSSVGEPSTTFAPRFGGEKSGKAPPESRLLPGCPPTIKTPTLCPNFTGPIFTLDRIIEIGTILPLEKRPLSGRQAIAGGIAGVTESAFVKVNV